MFATSLEFIKKARYINENELATRVVIQSIFVLGPSALVIGESYL